MRKSILLLAVFIGMSTAFAQGTASGAKWIKKTSCNKKAALVANQAMESMMNLEYLIAYGQAQAALLLDPDCGCAQLTIAKVSSGNKEWGSRKSKLSAIDRNALSQEEKGWYDVLTASNEDYENEVNKAKSKFPKSPLFNYLFKPFDFKAHKKFTEDFPNNAASAYNMVSYGYARGEYGAASYEKAMEAANTSAALHNGPNVYDSKAEHAFEQGNYKEALQYQRKAVDFAIFASPYWEGAKKYYYLVNKEKIAERLIKDQKEMQDAMTNGDAKKFAKYIDANIPLVVGSSNLEPFDVLDATFKLTAAVTWKSFELYDSKVHFSPDMNTAVITYYAKGAYVVKGTDTEVAYNTRASSVWVDTDNGWKNIHQNWAPQKNAQGIPPVSK
ncbi:MAG: nuclear transport factor 2 family protein [Polaribacter sp.]|nr:nuclear transport factor 2 family protein [Polaribacter sp.]